MYLFMIQATPGPNAELGEEEPEAPVAGAYVNCWINFQNREGAERLAAFYIEDQGWTLGKVEEVWEIDPVADQGDDAPFVAEAMELGYSLVFNCYPPEEDEDQGETTAKREDNTPTTVN